VFASGEDEIDDVAPGTGLDTKGLGGGIGIGLEPGPTDGSTNARLTVGGGVITFDGTVVPADGELRPRRRIGTIET